MPKGKLILVWIKEKLFNIHFLNVLVIVGAIFAIMSIMVQRKAVDPEALVNFQYMREYGLQQVWTQESVPGHFATFRPITVSLIRIVYLIFGVNPPAFFSVNIILFSVAALLLYFIIYSKTNKALPALIAALLFVTDWRGLQTFTSLGKSNQRLPPYLVCRH